MTIPDTIIFLHIPKTAGTTLNRILAQQYDSDQIFFLGSGTQESIRAYQNLAVEEKTVIRVVSGHTAYGFHEFVPGSSTYISILRDPVDRVVSFYHYVKNHEQHYLNTAAASEFDGIKPFIESRISPMLDNGQTRLISGVWLEPRFGEISDRIFEQAKTNLSKRFTMVGLTEQFDATLLLLQEKFGWQNINYLPQNVSRVAPRQRKLTTDEREAVLNINHWDVALYEYAEILFKQQIAFLDSDFEARLESFQRQNSRHQAIKEPLLRNLQRAKQFSIRTLIRRAQSR